MRRFSSRIAQRSWARVPWPVKNEPAIAPQVDRLTVVNGSQEQEHLLVSKLDKRSGMFSEPISQSAVSSAILARSWVLSDVSVELAQSTTKIESQDRRATKPKGLGHLAHRQRHL